jgi:nicotinate phosphoribosyltransferase
MNTSTDAPYLDCAYIAFDTLTLADDPQSGKTVLEPVMKGGKRTAAAVRLSAIRRHAASQLERLPPALRTLEPAAPYEVAISASLCALAREVDSRQA